jgi:bacteriocin biosynthesis cyclodehydratase domain-containing protein
MLLHLDPAVPLVWRDPTTLQLGVDPVVAVIPDVTSGLERLVAVLASGVSDTGYPMLAATFGVGAVEAQRLLDAVAGCLVQEPADATPLRAAVLGDGSLAHGIARLLDEAGLRTSDAERPDLVVLVADRVIPPAEHRSWLQRDIPHLPVVASDAAITVGPFVEPGATACLHCLDLHRRDDDPAWPAIATQLTMLAAPVENPLRTASAVALASRLVARRLRMGAGDPHELRIAADGDELTERVVLPHPECRCAAPQGSDWGRAGDLSGPHPTTTATASVGHE